MHGRYVAMLLREKQMREDLQASTLIREEEINHEHYIERYDTDEFGLHRSQVRACKLYTSYQHIRRACLCIQECSQSNPPHTPPKSAREAAEAEASEHRHTRMKERGQALAAAKTH